MPVHDADAVRQAPSSARWPLLPHDVNYNGDGEARRYVTTWTFPFDSANKASAIRAFGRAQEKRRRLRTKHFGLPAEAFQLSSFAPCVLGSEMNVTVVGQPIVCLAPELEPEDLS
jgi:hypothetical protein